MVSVQSDTRVARRAQNVLKPPLPSLYVRLVIERESASLIEDKFTLRSTNGAWIQTKVPCKDGTPAEEFLDLVFVGLNPSLCYTLEVVRGDADPRLIFEELPYEEIDSVSPYMEEEPPEAKGAEADAEAAGQTAGSEQAESEEFDRDDREHLLIAPEQMELLLGT